MSQPGPHSQPESLGNPGSLGQAEQQQLIQEIGRTVLRVLPPGWQEIGIEYRAVGGHSELVAQLSAPNGTIVPLAPPGDIVPLFARLRHGMYEPQRGTWISALYRLQRPSSYSVDFNGDFEPAWQTPPPAQALDEELQRYPRAEGNVPAWLAERAGLPAADGTTQPTLRTAEVFDASGRPITDHPAVAPQEREQIADYLEQAPIVLTARSFDTDQIDPARPATVPLTFHTDGSWIWSGAVGYYLRRHDVAPEPDLLTHIRGRGFRLPEVDEPTKDRAVAVITGESP